MSAIATDDKAAYVKTRNTTKLNVKWEMKEKVFVKKTDNFIIMLKQSYNSFERKYILPDHVILLKRSYCKTKSFHLTRAIITLHRTVQPHPTLKCSTKQSLRYLLILKYFATVMKKKIFLLKDPYIRTNDEILSKVRDFVYDQINQKSGGVFESLYQDQGLRDTQQVYCQKTKRKSVESEEDEFELLLRLQRQDINFVKALASLSKSYYVFIGNDVQLHDADCLWVFL